MRRKQLVMPSQARNADPSLIWHRIQRRPALRNVSSKRPGYTLAELMVLVALAAIAIAMAVEIGPRSTNRGRWINGLSVSDDGARVVATFVDGTVAAWETASGAKVASLQTSSDF